MSGIAVFPDERSIGRTWPSGKVREMMEDGREKRRMDARVGQNTGVPQPLGARNGGMGPGLGGLGLPLLATFLLWLG